MDLYQCRSQFNYELTDIRPYPSENNNNQLSEINFIFSTKIKLSDWISREDSTAERRFKEYDEEVIDYLVSVSPHQFCCSEETRMLMAEELMNLPVDSNELRGLIEYSWNKVFDFLESNYDFLSWQETVDFHFDLVVEHHHIFREVNMMVPAADSAVKSLKRVRVEVDCGRRNVVQKMSCSICLEEYSGGRGGCDEEALSMPCSHVFHGDCIKKWLRTSHYCPLCRFEMPVEEMDRQIDIEVSA